MCHWILSKVKASVNHLTKVSAHGLADIEAAVAVRVLEGVMK